MNDLEQEIRRALRGMLGPIEPASSLRRETVSRAKVRRSLSAAIAGTMAVLVIGAAAWGAIAIRQGSSEDSPKVVGGSPSEEQADAPRLYLAGDGELWRVDLQGNVKHVELSQLTPGDAPYRIVRRHGRLVAWGYETLLLDPGLESPPRVLVPDSWIFIPSAQEDRVWVSVMDPETRDTRRAFEFIREVNVEGEVTVDDVKSPEGNWPERALEAGLVFSQDGDWIVWDPASQTVVFRIKGDDLGPAYGNLIAWCDADCRSVHITDVSTGSDKTVEPPEGWAAFDVWAGTFSPDGTTLALPVRQRVRNIDEPDPELQLSLIDVADGTATTVEGSSVGDGYNFVEWAPSGEYVFFAGAQRSGDRNIVVYRMGDETAQPLQVHVGEFFGMAAL